MKEQILELIDLEIRQLNSEMKNLDEQYIQRQIRVRELRKTKASIKECPAEQFNKNE